MNVCSLRLLNVLIWKNAMVKRRRYVHYFFELLFTFVWTLILFALFGWMFSVGNPTDLAILRESKDSDYILKLKNKYICYLPDTNLTKMLMSEANNYINLKPEQISVCPSDVNDNKNISYRVIFKNIDFLRTSFPQNLVYDVDVIKYTGTYPFDFAVEILDLIQLAGEHENVAGLQSAIDRAFIKTRTGFDLPQVLSFQELRQKRNSTKKVYHPTKAKTYFILMFGCIFGLITFVSQLVSNITYEKLTGFEEMQRMVGVSSFTLLWSHIITSIPTCFVFVTGTTLIMFNCSELLALSNSYWVLISLILFGFFASLMMFFVFVSRIFTTLDNLASNVKLIALLAFIAALAIHNIGNKFKRKMIIAASVFDPFLPLMIALFDTYELEVVDKGLTVDEIWWNPDTASVGTCLLLFLVQFILYFLLAWCLTSNALPDVLNLFKFITKVVKCKRSKNIINSKEEVVIYKLDDIYFEDIQTIDATVTFNNVSKIYNSRGKKLYALRNVNLNIYKKLITVILGHNGCGKTTLMSILTGMIKPTTGEILIQGKKNSNRKVRKFIGYCSQNEISHRSLNVLQHMMFFGMLKGRAYCQSKIESVELLKVLKIPDKSKALPSELSGGMLRRLQLACAMSGGSRLLVLDEPSSGLDMQSRRELWDVIMELRKTCTIFLSTHYLEEADALADNVAILHQGMIVAFASPMHLKHAVDLGYHLTMLMTDNYSLDKIKSQVIYQIPNAVVKSSSNRTVVFVLPSKDSHKFVSLFHSLEDKKQELGIVTIGVSETTLEDAFLKIINIEEIENINIAEEKTLLKGVLLHLQQVYILFVRQLKFLRYRIISFLLIDVMITILLVYYITPRQSRLVESPWTRRSSSFFDTMSIGQDNKSQTKSIYYTMDDNYKFLIDTMKKAYPEYNFIESRDIVNDTLRVAETNVVKYKDILGGILLNDTNAKIYYASSVKRGLPSAVNMLFNIISNMFMRTDSGADVFQMNMNVIRSHPEKFDFDKFTWSMCISAVSSIKLVSLMTLPFRERITGARQSHILAGCSIYTYWLTTYLFHIIFYTILIQTPAMICLKLITKVDDFIVNYYIVSLLHVLTTLPWVYVFSEFGSNITGSIALMDGIVIVSGVITPAMQLLYPGDMEGDSIFLVIILISSAIPIFHYPMALFYTEKNFTKDSVTKNAYYNFMRHIIAMAIAGIIFWIFLIILQFNIIAILYNKYFDKFIYKPPPLTYFDVHVKHDAKEVKKKLFNKDIKTRGDENPDIHLTYNLHKCYEAHCGSKIYAVKGISLAIKRGEILGVLGVNGSGKSTTFNMFTGHIAKTRGELYCNGHRIGLNSRKYLSSIVYCPQFGGVDDYLGIYDNLLITCVLKGIPLVEAYNIAREWSNMSRANHIVPVHLLSGGERRHCTTLATLAASRHIALLDEPTAGVDVVARRTIWKALTSMNKTIVLSSHSMEETEALCSRIAILSQGELVALATPIQLRTERANGFNVTLQLNFTSEKAIMERLTTIKLAFMDMLQCRIIDEHHTSLRFHVDIGYTYSQLFASVEQFTKEFPEIVFYTVNDTSLEEVFMEFVRDDSVRSAIRLNSLEEQ